MKNLFATFLFLCGVLQNAHAVGEPVNCEGAPQQAVVRFNEPVNQWALVFCSPDGHVISPIDGYVWLTSNNKPFFFKSLSSSGERVRNNQHGAYFIDQGHRKMDDEGLEKAKKMFEIVFGQSAGDVTVYQLDVLSLGGLLYNIFFYTQQGKLDRIIGCINQCEQTVSLRQLSLEEARRESDKK